MEALRASEVALVVKNLPADAGDTGDVDSTSGLGRSPGRGHGNPLQYSCLENSIDGGAWWATVHGVTKSWTQWKRLSPHMWENRVSIKIDLGMLSCQGRLTGVPKYHRGGSYS